MKFAHFAEKFENCSTSNLSTKDGAVLVEHELLERRARAHLATGLLDDPLHGCADPVRLVAVQESHLQTCQKR